MEEAKSVIGVICSSYDSFFDSEKKIANCIMERKREVVDMTGVGRAGPGQRRQ